MKEAILTWVNNVKATLANRRSAMPAGLKAHQSFISDIEANEQSLDSFKEAVEKLDESKQASFTATLFVLMIDSVVPVFRAWRARFISIQEKRKQELEPHQKAFSEFLPLKLKMIAFIEQLNTDGSFVSIPETCQERATRHILETYDRRTFIETHELQTQSVKNESSASLHKKN